MNVFVDANILLAFYGLSPRELEELRKLVALIDAGDIVLWLPDNVLDEVERNREKVISEATKPLKESRLRVSLPELSSGLPERQQLEESLQQTQKQHSALLTAVDNAVLSRSLEADKVISQLQSKARVVQMDRSVLEKARERRERRRPPGKADSLGDAINWECLLSALPKSEDIHLVAADSDFRSPLDNTRIRDYLAVDWHRCNGGSAHLYASLGAFSKAHFPALDLATDVPKLHAISRLARSSTFAMTHVIVATLSNFDIFTPEQARMLLRAAAENSQVRWIARDDDVRILLQRVIDAHRDHVDPSLVAVLEAEMHPPSPPDVAANDDDAPF